MTNAAIAAKKYFTSSNIKSIQYASGMFARKYKIVVFVPLKNADELTFKMAHSGAGNIGRYSVCSFRTKGVGTFIGGRGSQPKAGKKGKFEMLEEIRLEMICEQSGLEKVVNAVYDNHPYEEPACEIYPVIVKENSINRSAALVQFKKPVKVIDVLKKVNSSININELPLKLPGTSVKQAFIDLTGSDNTEFTPLRDKTIVIRKNKNIINFEVK